MPIRWRDTPADGVDSAFGLGDVVQSLFVSPQDPVNGWILGAGPAFLLPTATDDAFKSKQFGLGPTVVGLRQESGWTYGALANHIWGLNDPNSVEQVNASLIQPFLVYTWPTATSLGLNSESTYDWEENDWLAPFNLFVSQVKNISGIPVNFQLGGHYYVDSPDGGPDWGLRANVTLMFPK